MAAEVFPVGVFIADELAARRWTVRDLAERMGGDVDVNHCALDLLMLAPERGMIIGADFALQLSAAFGTSAELWERLDKTWRESQP